MDKTCIESFTHKQLKKLVEIKHSTGLEDSLIIIENDRPDIDFFKSPCRIDSLVALVCLSGEMTININLNEYHIQPGTMILNLPENIVQLNSEQQCSFYGISVTRSFFEKVQINLSDIIPVYSQLRNEPCLRLSKDEIEIFCKFISLIKLISQSTEGSKKMETLQNLGAALIWQLYDLILNYTPVSKNENKKKNVKRLSSGDSSLCSRNTTCRNEALPSMPNSCASRPNISRRWSRNCRANRRHSG